jgi:hypothetical protein
MDQDIDTTNDEIGQVLLFRKLAGSLIVSFIIMVYEDGEFIGGLTTVNKFWKISFEFEYLDISKTFHAVFLFANLHEAKGIVNRLKDHPKYKFVIGKSQSWVEMVAFE